MSARVASVDQGRIFNPLECLLDPAGLLGVFELQVQGRGEVAGRPVLVVQAELREPDSPRPVAIGGLAPGADRYILYVDAQRGILLRTDALLGCGAVRHHRDHGDLVRRHSEPVTWDRWTALVMGFLVLVGGLGFIVGPNDSAQLSTCIAAGGVNEGSGRFDAGGSLWPPGKRCRFYHRDGSTTSIVKPATPRAILTVVILLVIAVLTPLVLGALARRWWARISC